MNVLMVRIGGKVSGAEVYNLKLLKALKKYRDIGVTFLTNLKELSERVSELGVKAFEINPPVLEIGTKRGFLKALSVLPQFIFLYLRTIKKLENNKKFNLICLQSMTEKIFLTPILKRMSYKILWIEHGPLFISSRSNLIKKLYVFSSIFVDKIIAVSLDTKNDLMSGGVNTEKIEVLYIGVEIPKNPKKILPKKNIYVGFVGSVSEEKGVKEFIEVSKLLVNKNSSFKFLVIGEGPMFDFARLKVKNIDLEDKYEFSKAVKDVEPYFSLMDILFFPTKHNEGLSMTVLEALSMGIPIVASDIGGNREIIKNGFNGYLYKQNENLQKIVQLIMKAYKNETFLSKNARQSAIENFDIEKNAYDFYQLFKTL